MAKNVTGEIILANESGDTASLPVIPAPILEAIFNTVTGAKESISISRRKASKVEMSDLYQLKESLLQWSSTYAPISSKLEYVVSSLAKDEIKGRTRTRYTSYDSLSEKESAKTNPTESVAIHYTFTFRGESSEKLEIVELIIDLSSEAPQYVYAANEKDLFGLRNHRRHDREDVSMSLQVKYTNYLVAKGIVGVVDEWYEHLPDVSLWMPPKVLKLISTDETYDKLSPVSIFLKTFPAILSIGFVRGIYLNFFAEAELNQISLIGILFSAILIYAFFDVVFRVIIKKTENLTYNISVRLVRLNAGDQRSAERYETDKINREERFKLVFRSLILAFVVSVCAGVFVNLI